MLNRSISNLWARTSLLLWPEDLVLASFAVETLPDLVTAIGPHLGGFSALVVERDEVSLTIGDTAWRLIQPVVRPTEVAGPFRAITFDLAIDLDVCGYLLPAAERLATEGISIVPQCAFQKDHLLVAASQSAAAMAVLEGLVADARALAGE